MNGGSFSGRIPATMTSTAPREDHITLRAQVLSPALESQLTWKVENWQSDNARWT